MKAIGADVVLIDPQFAPKVIAKPEIQDMVDVDFERRRAREGAVNSRSGSVSDAKHHDDVGWLGPVRLQSVKLVTLRSLANTSHVAQTSSLVLWTALLHRHVSVTDVG